MIFDFDHAETPAPSHADVCILGAGAAGVALATELAARGRRVVVLEGGGPEHESRSQSLYHSDVVTQPHRGIHHGRFRTLGGSTTRWGGQMLELQPIDFAQRAWVPGSGWPFPKSELAPFYERALAFAGLRRVERNDEAVWSALGLSVDPAAFARDALAPELAMLFSRWLPVRNVAEIYASTLRDSRRIELHTHASAVGFRLNAAGDRVDGVRVRGFSGRTVDVTANNFVICLGGIESARLLLQPSGDGSLPWQRNGVLGKHYQDHIAVNRIPVRALAVREPWKVFGYNTAAGFRYHNKLWLTSKEQERYETLNVAGTLSADVPASSAERDEALQRLRDLARKRERPSLAELARLAPHAAAIASGRLRERIVGEEQAWQRVMLTVHSEQSPQGTSSITLGDTRDALGLWRTRLDWRIADAELHTIRTYVRLAAEAFARNGFAKIVAPDDFFTDDAMLRARCEDSFHHMGATRMSASASDGVVDPELRLHGIANAYVCSSSVFPSSGFSNPTHTLLALSMRLADKLAKKSSAQQAFGILSDAKDPLPARSLDTARESLRSIHLPHTNATTSQLGFGCAYLLGQGLDREASRRVLDAAWDAGIRHFDAARLYGMGDTETMLGEFLRTHPEATVTT
jgi:choline dehydrogenase-like flavoprotein